MTTDITTSHVAEFLAGERSYFEDVAQPYTRVDGEVVHVKIAIHQGGAKHFRAVVVEGEETPALLTGPLAEVARWRDEENARMGDLTPPDGTGDPHYRQVAEDAYRSAFEAFRDGEGTWVHVFAEAASKAFAESDPAKLRAQLVKVAAEAVCWVEAIDRRSALADLAESRAGR